MQMMLAQTRSTLNLRQVMDAGGYVLANLGGISAPETTRLIGALLVNGIFHAAKQRDTRKRRPWFLICDEFGEFATQDFANSLDQLRKFGVHLILAHQRLRQLEREGSDVLSAVMTNARIKVVFGGLERPEAERMTQELFTGQMSGDEVKHVTRQTKFRPVADTFVVETETFSEASTDAWSETVSESTADTTSAGALDSTSESWELEKHERAPGSQYPSNVGKGASSSKVRSSSSNDGSASTDSSSSTTSRGTSRSVVPITRHEEFSEETGRQFYTLEEMRERFVALVHGLAKRQALIRIYNSEVLNIWTPDVQPERNDRRLERFRRAILEQCPHALPTEVVVAEIEARRLELAEIADTTEAAGRPFKVESFRE
jgi:hypothetical protein